MRHLTALLLLSAAACHGPVTQHEPEPPPIPGMKTTGVAGGLLFGGQPDAAALEELAKRGYRTVLSTRGEGEVTYDERAAVESLGMTFVHIPMNKPVLQISDQQVTAFSELMEDGEGPMVLHCGSGNRVAGLWAVWLVEHEGLDPADALAQAAAVGMGSVRPVVEARLWR